MQNISKITLGLLAIGLVACSNNDKPAPAAVAPAPAPVTQPVNVVEVAEPIQLNHAATYEYWWHAKKVDYAKIADVISRRYRNEQDPTKKDAILSDLKPGIDIAIKDVEKWDDYYLEQSADLTNYDTKTYAFEDKNYFLGNEMVPYNPVIVDPKSNSPFVPKIYFTNSDRFKTIKTFDEDLIDKLNALNDKHELKEKIYFTISGVSAQDERIEAVIDVVEYYDKDGNIVMARHR